MKISVVVATYNGERYIMEQLNSILNQSHKIDEVIIMDDCSKDDTVKIIANFICANNLKNWFFYQNEKNVGWMINFKNGIFKSSGEIVFLADQDDIWEKDKIKLMTDVMDKNQEIELLASDFGWLINNNYTYNVKSKELIEKKYLNKRFIYVRRPGCVYAVKRNLINELKPYWNDLLPHDEQLWLLSYVRHSLYIYHKPLIKYRRHEATETGRDKLTMKVKMRNAMYEKRGLELVHKYVADKNIISYEEMKIINSCERYIERRINYFQKDNILCFYKLIPYLKNYTSFKTFLGDILIKLKTRNK